MEKATITVKNKIPFIEKEEKKPKTHRFVSGLYF